MQENKRINRLMYYILHHINKDIDIISIIRILKYLKCDHSHLTNCKFCYEIQIIQCTVLFSQFNRKLSCICNQ